MSNSIVKIGDAIFVEWVDRQWSRPVERTVRWRVTKVSRSEYRPAWPEHGDVLHDVGTAAGMANYHGNGYSVHFPSNQQGEIVSDREVPPPKVRAGIEVRWERGRWEKYLKTKGWVAAE